MLIHRQTFAMNFAQRELEKYGWTEGSGLGKNQTGITEALKPKVKLNKGGIGHDFAKEHTDFWWEKSFNKAARSLKVEVSANDVRVKSAEDAATNKKNKNLYLGFVKKGTNKDPADLLGGSGEPEELVKNEIVTLTDEELFKACGGRTSHKAARHGLKLSGKLARIQQQEEAILGATKKSNEVEKKRPSIDLVKTKRKKLKSAQ